MSQKKTKNHSPYLLSLAALGIVYGDIGTSPLYALRASLHGLPINQLNVFGALSLIFWSLIAIVSIKYLIILLRADNNGEGGVLALLALIKRIGKGNTRILLILAILGAGLVLGDGMLTPAISVVSAIEGLHLVAPHLANYIVPLTCLILFCLFYVQSYGTAKIGFIFGPILLMWFTVIAFLGLLQIIRHPMVLGAMSPYYAIEFFQQNGWKGYALLGGVFLVVTGGETLYADLGHFGKKPIRCAWFAVVLPCLLLNYFGQGAYLLEHPAAIANPFYSLAPSWFLYPLLILATFATIIASQAVIAATFSLTKQAILLGFYPHLPIVQTSSHASGQIYIPQMNRILMMGTLLLVIIFKSSSALTNTYGIAVNLVMVLTSLLMIQLLIKQWSWVRAGTLSLIGVLSLIDMAFLGSNIQKLDSGGWLPILFAMICAFIMFTWCEGRKYLHRNYYIKKSSLDKLLTQLHDEDVHPVPDMTAIFITDVYDKSGGNFLHFLKMNHILPEVILIISYVVHNVPYVSVKKRCQGRFLYKNIYKLTLHYGFMDTVSIPKAISEANIKNLLPFYINTDIVTYFIENSNVIASRLKKTLYFYWQEQLFAYLARNYSVNLDIEFYHLPYDRTIALGAYYMI